jgi:hypothetical protein
VRRDVRCWSLGRLAVDDAVRRDLSGPAVTIEFDCKGETVVAHAGILSIQRLQLSSVAYLLM